METLITAKKIASNLGITVRHLYNLMEEPGFPARIKVGERAIRFKEKEVIEWIESRKVTA